MRVRDHEFKQNYSHETCRSAKRREKNILKQILTIWGTRDRATLTYTGSTAHRECAVWVDPNRLGESPTSPSECALSRKLDRNWGAALVITGMNLRVLPASSFGVPSSAYGRLGTRAIRTLAALPAAAQCGSPVTTMLMAAEYERDTIRLWLAAGCIALGSGWCLIHEPRVPIPEQLLRRKCHAVPDTCATCQAPRSKWAV